MTTETPVDMHNPLPAYRVWPDGTVQCTEDGEAPYLWMSDDFTLVYAEDEDDALLKFDLLTANGK